MENNDHYRETLLKHLWQSEIPTVNIVAFKVHTWLEDRLFNHKDFGKHYVGVYWKLIECNVEWLIVERSYNHGAYLSQFSQSKNYNTNEDK